MKKLLFLSLLLVLISFRLLGSTYDVCIKKAEDDHLKSRNEFQKVSDQVQTDFQRAFYDYQKAFYKYKKAFSDYRKSKEDDYLEAINIFIQAKIDYQKNLKIQTDFQKAFSDYLKAEADYLKSKIECRKKYLK